MIHTLTTILALAFLFLFPPTLWAPIGALRKNDRLEQQNAVQAGMLRGSAPDFRSDHARWLDWRNDSNNENGDSSNGHA